MVEPIRCPRPERARILSSFSRLHRRHLGKKPSSGHPRDADLLWRLSGGGARLGNALSALDRVVREAAARGCRDLPFGSALCRLGGGAA